MDTTKHHYDFYSRLNQRLADALMAGLAFYLAYQIRFEWELPPESAFQMWLFLSAVMLGQVLVSALLGTYRLVWRYISVPDAFVVARSYAVFSALLVAVFFAVPDRWVLFRIPRSVIVIQFLLSFLGALSARALRRLLHDRVRIVPSDVELEKAKRIVLIGAGRAGMTVAEEIALRPHIRAVGFLDDDPKKLGSVIGGLRVLGPLSALPSVVRKYSVEEAVICIARIPRETLKTVWALAEPLPVRTKIVPTVEEILSGRKNIAAFRDVELSDLLHRDPVKLPSDEAELATAYRGKRILITGAGGSIGSELTCQLFDLKPAELILLDKDENGLHEICLRLPAASDGAALHPVVADIRFPKRLDAVFGRFRPEVVFHAAAHKHVHLMEVNPCEAILNNVVGTRNLVECSLASGVSRFVLISTDKAVKPTCIMGASKRLCEMLIQAARHPNGHSCFCCVRFGNVIGSRGSVVPIFRQQILEGQPVTLTHPDAERYLMTIPEAVNLLIQARTLGSAGEIFLLEMGKPVRIKELAVELIEHSGLRPGHDIPIKVTQLRPGEKMSEELADGATEKILPTRCEKISMIQARPFDAEVFARKLGILEEAARRESPQEVVRILGELNIGFRPTVASPSTETREKALGQAVSAQSKMLARLSPLPDHSSS